MYVSRILLCILDCFFVVKLSSLRLCYLLNFIDDITQYGACYTVSIKLFEFEFVILWNYLYIHLNSNLL